MEIACLSKNIFARSLFNIEFKFNIFFLFFFFSKICPAPVIEFYILNFSRCENVFARRKNFSCQYSSDKCKLSTSGSCMCGAFPARRDSM